MNTSQTPREILELLDQYVVGQQRAKRAVAVAMRNRWRRRQLDPALAQDVYPKNILLIGPTGVGKTEIARRLAALARAPFVKVEASKYSEVGYHGRDVESMVRDLMEAAVALVRQEHAERVREQARTAADERLLANLAAARGLDDIWETSITDEEIWRPRPGSLLGVEEESQPEGGDEDDDEQAELHAQREELRQQLAAGELDDEEIEIELLDRGLSALTIMGPQGTEAMGIDTSALQEAWGRSPMVRTKLRKLTVAAARDLLVSEEADKLVDNDAIAQDARDRAENDGIVFLDEIDKVIGAGKTDGPDVSREGVQRDLLPIVEGCAVYTKYGHVRTDHILFIAAGAFHFHKPSELIPELQGRFPVRVALQPLTEADFVRILTEPRNSLVRQYQALFATEGVTLEFSVDGIERLAAIAFRANKVTQNIGARRLMTILEKCLEDLSFSASEQAGAKVLVDAALVERNLGETADDADLIPYDM
ncbi:MAG: ATP-dependent protease ATPase subunit HslU [Planctomycetes bacterium]|nr:ATP-dependent protease ATPase subunit HslU [Planctomycetota bacterium]